jgi:RNA polymerase sigma factor (sigma-70 family)
MDVSLRRIAPSVGHDGPAGRRLAEDLDGLYRFVLLLTGDDQAAQDVVQETAARALAAADRFRGEASARTWLHRIAHNVVIDAARRSGRVIPTADVEALWRDDRYTVDTAEVVERASDRAELEDPWFGSPRHSARRSSCTTWKAGRSRRSPPPLGSGSRPPSSGCAGGGWRW